MISDPEIGRYPLRVQRDFEADQWRGPLCTLALYETATSQWGWCFHTLRGGKDPSNLRLFSRVVEVVEIWMNFQSGKMTASSPGAAGPRRWPERHLFPRAGSMTQQPTSGIGVSTPCGAESTRGISVYAP